MSGKSALPLLCSATHQATLLLRCSFSGLEQHGAVSSALAAASVAAAKTERARSRDRRPPGPPRTDAHQNIRGHLHAYRLTRRQPALRFLPEAPGEEKLQLQPPKKKVPAEAEVEGLRADFPCSRLCQVERDSLIPVHLRASCSPANRCRAVGSSLCSCNLTGFTLFFSLILFYFRTDGRACLIYLTTRCRRSTPVSTKTKQIPAGTRNHQRCEVEADMIT